MLSAYALLFNLITSIFATPLLLSPPTLFNLPSLNPTTLSSVNTTLHDDFHCFEQRSDRRPTDYQDCENAITEMHRSTDHRRYIFGRGRSATYKLPRTFQSGTCVINLDMVYDEDNDKLTFLEVRGAALALALRCTSGPIFRVGGVKAVEPKKVLYITILGAVPLSTY